MPVLKKESGSYDDFLSAILAYESTIDPNDHEYYEKNYNNPIAVTYQNVESPGRVVRDQDGHTTSSPTSIKGYFERLGIDKYYTLGSTDPQMFSRMQHAVLNYLGFVGYQFSEQDLWDLGYYTHYDEHGLPTYYSDVPVSNWADGVRDKVMVLPGKGIVHVTDVNTWGGTFTGKDGVNNFNDAIDPEKQDIIARGHFRLKHRQIVILLAEQGKTLNDYIGTTIRWDECQPVLTPPTGVPEAVEITMSGLLAGAHLRGAEGVVALLVDHENRADENGTAILQYVYQFGGYDTPFDRDQT